MPRVLFETIRKRMQLVKLLTAAAYNHSLLEK